MTLDIQGKVEARERARERLRAAMGNLEQGINSILDSESFARYLRAMSRFHDYSAHNVALILAQRPDATHVASYKTWQRLGRQVRKGEHGVVILVPLKCRVIVETEEGDEEEGIATRFGTGHVFDIGQTEGDPLPVPPTAEAITAATDPGAELYRRLQIWLEGEGVTVTTGDTGDARGTYNSCARTITIGERILDTDHAAKTLAHEAAHHVAQHDALTARDDREAVAEGAAYVVMQHYGIESGGYSFGYIAGWARDKAVLKRNLEAIQQTARTIIDGLESEEEGPAAA